MKKFARASLMATLGFTLLTTIAFAQTPMNTQPPGGGGSGGGGKTGAAVSNLVGGYGVDQLEGTPTALFHQSKDAVYNLLVGNVLKALLIPNQVFPVALNPEYKAGSKKPATLTGEALVNLLTQTNTGGATQKASKIPAPLPLSSSQMSYGFLGASPIGVSESPENVDADSLLGPLQYDEKTKKSDQNQGILSRFEKKQQGSSQQQAALNYIYLASGAAHPVQIVDLSQMSVSKLKKAIQSNEQLQKYIVALHIYAARQSVVLGNLYYLYALRVPHSTKDIEKNIPELKNTPLKNKASEMNLIHYMVMRRFTDKKWETAIQKTATPAELLRQLNYQLRLMNLQLYNQNVMNQRMLITMTLFLRNASAAQRIYLEEEYRTLSKSLSSSNDSSSSDSNFQNFQQLQNEGGSGTGQNSQGGSGTQRQPTNQQQQQSQ